jgi:aspartyl-tRNA(Asn)/glutamyl-tRNA(Gln) amidotransferase subunit C
MIDLEEVKHIAQLARIEFSEKQLKGLQKDLGSILEYFKKLEEVALGEVDVFDHSADLKSVTREDVPEQKDSKINEKLLGLAPQTKARFIKVKSVFNL